MTITWIKFWVCAAAVCAVSSIHAAHSLSVDQLQQDVALALVLDHDADRTRLGTKTIGHLYAGNAELTDCIAEMFGQTLAKPQVGKVVDVLAVYVDVLGKSKNPRYRDLLHKARRGRNEEKVNREIDAALEQFQLAQAQKSSANQYVMGTCDVAARASAVRKNFADSRALNRSGLAKTRVGTDMRAVLGALGAPDDVSAITQVGSIGRRAVIVMHYYGQGLITFRLERDSDTHWTVFEVATELVPVKDSYQGNHMWFAQALASMRGIQYRNLIRFYQDQIQTDPEIISVLTRRLIVMDHLDDFEQDATNYIPEVLARTSVPNETVMWEQVKNTAKTRLIRKVAAARIKQLRKLAKRK